MEGDELLEAREQFFVGYYQKSQMLARSVTPSDETVERERHSLVARAKMALGELTSTEINEMLQSSSAALQAVAYSAEILQSSSDDGRRDALSKLRELSQSHEPTAKMLAAAALTREDSLNEALELTDEGTLEMRALRAQILLMMDRVDLAESVVAGMADISDDDVVTKIATVLVSIANGNYEESYLTCGDIQSQCCEADKVEGRSLTLLNGKAVANMQRKQWQEALEDLQRAYEQNPADADTLANLICCCHNMRRPDEANQYLSRLSQAHPRHYVSIKMAQSSQAFKSFAQSVQIST